MTVFQNAPEQTVETDKTDTIISNADFLDAIFGVEPSEQKPVIVSFAGNPSNIDQKVWFGREWDRNAYNTPVTHNNYFSISTFNRDGNGKYRRKKTSCSTVNAIVLDDIGTKVAEDKIRLPASWKLETSEGNYQVGYILADPLRDIALADKLTKALIAANVTDAGMNGVTSRLARLPEAVNGKHDPAFSCRMTEWHPERRYSVHQICEGFDISLDSPSAKKAHAKKERATKRKSEESTESLYTPKPDFNPIIEALKTKGLYKKELEKGKHDITCPWVHEHTDSVDSGTVYFEPSEHFAIGGFKCQHGHCAERNITDILDYLGLDASDAKMKPIIRMQPGHLHVVVDTAEEIVALTGNFYQRGGLIVSIIHDPSTRETHITQLTNASLTHALSKYVEWEGWDARSEEWVTRDPNGRMVNILLDKSSYKHLPVLLGLAHQPFLRDDNTLVCQNGYDAKSKMYGNFDATQFAINPKPTKAEAQHSLAAMDALLDDFGFAHASDRSAALAAMLTAAIRSSLPTAPLFHMHAPTYSSGKSYLCQVITAFATIRERAPVTFPGEEEECRKLLLSEYLRAPAVIEFDNITTDLKPHKSLCIALTSEFLSDRILCVSKTTTVSTRTLMLSSGNNVLPVKDMARRCITINLDTGMEMPATRTYKNPNLAQDVLQQRTRYVSHALTVILGWIHSGEEKPVCKPLGGYERWASLCRHPLLWLGYDDPATSVYVAMNEDPDRETLQQLLHCWNESFGDKPMQLRKALDGFSNASSELREMFYEVAGERDTVNRKRLGHYIKSNQGKLVDRLKFMRVAGNRSSAAWKVVSV